MSTIYIVGGPGKGQQFDLKGEVTYVGRSPENDVIIKDIYVSRRHLKILNRLGRYCIQDLESKNGTFVDGRLIPAGIEVEVQEGLLIVIGTSLICLGEGCSKYLQNRPDFIDLAKEVYQDGMALIDDRPMTGQKNKELMQRVSEVLARESNLDSVLEEILDYIFDILKRIDRVIIILVDKRGTLWKNVSKVRGNVDRGTTEYSQEVVRRVIRNRESFVSLNVGDEHGNHLSHTLKFLSIGSVMCVPLIGGGPIRGVIYMDSLERSHGFRKEDVFLLTALARPVTSAVEKALLN